MAGDEEGHLLPRRRRERRLDDRMCVVSTLELVDRVKRARSSTATLERNRRLRTTCCTWRSTGCPGSTAAPRDDAGQHYPSHDLELPRVTNSASILPPSGATPDDLRPADDVVGAWHTVVCALGLHLGKWFDVPPKVLPSTDGTRRDDE